MELFYSTNSQRWWSVDVINSRYFWSLEINKRFTANAFHLIRMMPNGIVFWGGKTEKGDERKICIKNKCCCCCKQSSFCCNVHASYPFNHSYKLERSSSIGHIMHFTVHTNMDKLYAHTWSVQCTLSLVMVFICIKPNQGHVLLINVEYIQAIIFVWSYLHKHFVSSYCLLAGAKQLWSDIFYTSIFVEELFFR